MMNNHNHHVHQNGFHHKSRSEVSQISITDDDAQINRKLPKELLLRIFSFLDVVTLCRCAQVSKYWNLLALDGSNWQRVDLFDFQVDVKVRRQDGDDYPPESIRLLCVAVWRYLRDKCRRYDLNMFDKTKAEFAEARECLDGRMKKLQPTCSKKKQAEPISTSEERVLWERVFSKTDAKCLQYAVYFYACKLFGLRAANEHSNLTVDQFQFGTDEEGTYIIFTGGKSKNTQGGLFHAKIPNKSIKHYSSIETSRCIVNLFKRYIGLIPESGPFYRRPLSSGMDGCPRYSAQKVGLHTIRQFMQTMCATAGIEGYKTGHSGKAPVVENISKRCGGFLKALSLKGCQNITDDALQKFAEQCKNIEELNLNNCKKLTDLTCESLGRHSKKLQHLDLSSCQCVTDKALKFISDVCHHLRHINVSWCKDITNDGLEALARGCLKLEDFICKGCNQITDVGVGHIAIHCKNIRRINLHSCQSITDDALQLIGEHCHDLIFLCVSNCQRLSDNALVSVANGCPALRTLEVACCSHLTDNGFQALAKNCQNLERMDLEECIQITDSTLNYLGSYCHRLTALSLSHCELITDEGIRHLGSSPCATEQLQVLELDNCPLITDASLEHLMGCQCLERIELYDCQLITRQGIRRLKTRLPNIRVHAYFAPVTPPASVGGGRQRYCKCCVIL